ncbi:MAG: hypothetical protein C4570_04770 [Ammonifex sp.]|jgi:hypothetical protein|nr:MAG: hypothetical protein C4570_04770 [Ammonifex sp.]
MALEAQAPRRVLITAGSVTVEAHLNDSKTASAVWDALPVTGRVNTWGDEIYFQVPFELPEENPRAVVEEGDVGYWPPGPALCIFFGPTPASRGNEIRPASPVNVLGRIRGDVSGLKQVKDGDKVTVEPASN